MESGKRPILQTMLDLHFVWSTPNCCFLLLPHKIRHQNKKSNAIICALSFVFLNPSFHNSSIPLFQLWAKRTKFTPDCPKWVIGLNLRQAFFCGLAKILHMFKTPSGFGFQSGRSRKISERIQDRNDKNMSCLWKEFDVASNRYEGLIILAGCPILYDFMYQDFYN